MKIQAQFAIKQFVASILFCCLSATIYGQNPNVELAHSVPIQALDKFVDSLAAKYFRSTGNSGLSLAILSKDSVRYFNYGTALPSGGKKAVYDLGGMSSVYCGALLQIAIHERKIQLDDDVRKYLPPSCKKLSGGSGPLRIIHLANHTSGLPNVPPDLRSVAGFDTLDPYANYTKQDVLNCLSSIQISMEPGSNCEYSSFGIGVLGMLISNAYGMSYDSLIQTKLFNSLDMHNSTIDFGQKPLLNSLENHDEKGNVVKKWRLTGLPAAGAVNSSSEDFMKMLQYLNADDKFNSQLYTAWYNGRRMSSLTWFLKRRNNDDLLCWQTGAGNGSRSFAGMLRDQKVIVLVLSNSSQEVETIGLPIINMLSK